jgi:2-dehydro-3-deoxy-D-arabinonate dehydratase
MDDDKVFKGIAQVIGCAYTYQASKAVRSFLTTKLTQKSHHHSAQTKDFSYFYKGNPSTCVSNNEALRLRLDPRTGKPTVHWPEPELAILLGNNHEFVGYALGNDFTAFEIEMVGRTADFDGTYHGKCWKGSCSIGPRFIPAKEIKDDGNLVIGLKIERVGEKIYDAKFGTKMRKRDFKELPRLILTYHDELKKQYQNNMPLSKKIQIEKNGMLPAGTVLLTGSILIVPPKCYSKEGDIITVYNAQIGELRNLVQ